MHATTIQTQSSAVSFTASPVSIFPSFQCWSSTVLFINRSATLRIKPYLFFSAASCLPASVFINSVSAAEPARVLVLPFTIHADKDLAYLKKGVADMLASRLALKDKVVVVGSTDSSLKTEQIPETIDAAAALALGAKSASDYVLFGSLTVFGK